MFDAHVHLDFLARRSDEETRREAVARYLSDARLRGVSGFALPGVEPDAWKGGAQLAQSIGAAFGVGIHPAYADSDPERDLERLRAGADDLRPHFVGETGLDKREEVRLDRARQERLFAGHLEIAAEFSVPIVLHVVGRHGRALEMLREPAIAKLGLRGMVHGFIGSWGVSEQYATLGFGLGIGERAFASERTVEVIRRAPIGWLLTESDEPQETSAVPAIVQRIADLRGSQRAEVADATHATAAKLFGL